MTDAISLPLREFHQELGARFTTVNGAEVVQHYGDASAEYTALHETAGVLDLSFRGRLCLIGADRVRFLHGQVTNDVKRLRVGEGCYAAIVTAKGKMESDVNIHALQDELLLDFEPGYSAHVAARLEKYIVADDVQVVDVSPHYGLLSVQGPKAADVVREPNLFSEIPSAPFHSVRTAAPAGEIYLINQPRIGTTGFDLFVPLAALAENFERIISVARSLNGCPCGWNALETARIEAGIPRYGADMDETNIPLECGIESRAISYNKGCYIGQEVINRIHSIGHVNRQLCRLQLADDLKTLPQKGDKLFKDGKEVGHVTSAVHSQRLKANLALGYVRREACPPGTILSAKTAEAEYPATVL